MAQVIYCDECPDEEKAPAFLVISFAGTGQVDAVCLAHWPDYLYNQVAGMAQAGMTELAERVRDAVVAASHVGAPTEPPAEEPAVGSASAGDFPMTENHVRSTHGHRKPKSPPPPEVAEETEEAAPAETEH